jgi:hypothetical protein
MFEKLSKRNSTRWALCLVPQDSGDLWLNSNAVTDQFKNENPEA